MSTPPATLPAAARAEEHGRRAPRAWWTREVGSSPWPLVATILAAALCVTGELLRHALAGSGLVHWDGHVERWFEAHRTTGWNRATTVGNFVAEAVTVAVLWVVAMLVAWRLTRALVAPLFILLTVGLEKLTYLGTSILVARPRPPVHPVGHTYATKSFPSGHVASSITLYGSIAVLLWLYGAPRMWRAIATAWVAVAPFVVAFSRMYRGFHYPTDVIAGALLGALWLAATTRWFLRPALSRHHGPGAPVRMGGSTGSGASSRYGGVT